ncbi:MAG TPA: PEGA domain-containing protein [Ignavibacteriaceae bacterium]|jgi:hypothetical protein|nr:MAG: PEGA domain protein [Ignavibacteria bacterium ADurb.Bin266]OQY71984.1 MAG: hypothetical protein B6D44_11675 [Ignavibacteriales bacterium UTCHB2]HQF41382.1 PEGA domain-containing protein [Ignavibacteriaceae bacterium]HQI41665.1 PEGA domain-containing protein [Ignavibacteriaceae bacterium]
MKKFYKIGLFFSFIAVTSLVFSSCATIFKGSTDDVSFSSDPSGAKVYVNGTLLGTTPVQLELKSKNSYTIEFKKEGYETRTVLLNNSVGGGWIVLDVLFGLVPIIVDAATGNWYSLDQEYVNAVLEQQK